MSVSVLEMTILMLLMVLIFHCKNEIWQSLGNQDVVNQRSDNNYGVTQSLETKITGSIQYNDMELIGMDEAKYNTVRQ